MASIMIHLAVAYRLAQSEGFCSTAIRDRGSYYLGAVAPDAVNMDGFAPKALRWAAHRREKTVKEWYHSIAGFWKTQLQNNRINPDLLLGYVVHILTDAAFDETLEDELRVTVIATGFDEKEETVAPPANNKPFTSAGARVEEQRSAGGMSQPAQPAASPSA